MRLIGYKVGDKNFGGSSKGREKAKEESKRTGKPVELRPYKI